MRNVDADEGVVFKCAGCYEMGRYPFVSQDDGGRVDLSPSSQHSPFGVEFFQGFVEKGDQAPE
jgi:hypothetical protein